MPTRRSVLFTLWAGALALGGVAAAARLDGWIRAEIAARFGPDYAEHPETAAFIEAFVARLHRDSPDVDQRTAVSFGLRPTAKARMLHTPEAWVRDRLLDAFLHSTTVVRADEGSEPFVFLGLYDPYDAACANPLSAYA